MRMRSTRTRALVLEEEQVLEDQFEDFEVMKEDGVVDAKQKGCGSFDSHKLNFNFSSCQESAQSGARTGNSL